MSHAALAEFKSTSLGMGTQGLTHEMGGLMGLAELVFKAQFPAQDRRFKAQGETPGCQSLPALMQSQCANPGMIGHAEGQIRAQRPRFPIILSPIARDDPLIGQNNQGFFET